MKKPKYDNSTNVNLQLFQPGSGWVPPKTFPNLRDEKRIGFDLETFDPKLHTHGPGGIRRDGKIVGISVATADSGWYMPFDHLAGGNLDKSAVLSFVGDLLQNPNLECVGANIIYELEWLASEGISPRAKFIDVQIAEALLDEERDDGYDLGTLSLRHLGQTKDETLLREAASAFAVDPKSGLWKLHSQFVGPYAIFDAVAPLLIFEKQLQLLQKDDLMEVFRMETELTPILWKMRQQGIPISLDKAAEASKQLKAMEDAHLLRLDQLVGMDLDIWSGKQIARACDIAGIKYPTTAKGNPSFEGDFLEHSSHKLLKTIAEARTVNRLRKTFVEDWINNNQINGRIHPQWKQLKSDDGGTRTGRMAASNPNPQQVPARSNLAPLIRGMFVPDEGRDWCKIDYSQQEPRLLVHYASLCNLNGADLIRIAYCENPAMDIYQFLAESSQMARKDAKAVTLGRMYGMGYRKFAKMHDLYESDAKEKLEQFDQHVPFVKELADKVGASAAQRGYVRTLGGRKRHFNYWEPVNSQSLRERGVNCMPQLRSAAIQRWPQERLQRAHTHKALNSLIQGSAADMTKRAIINIHNVAGIIPYMAVHDEINAPVENEKQANILKDIMESAYELVVPIRADMKVGRSWS